MAIKVSITSLRAAIGKAQQKADDAQASETENRILTSQIQAANARVESAESAVTRSEMTKQEAQDKLSPPPTKQITADGKKGGTKTVVDEREKDKLQAQVRAADVQIQQAQSAVEDARAEAERLSSEALNGAGISDEQQAAMGQLSDLMAELKTLAENDSTDLTGDDFQDKLKSAVDQADALAEDLPDTANEALNDFWEGIAEGFETIETEIKEATDYQVNSNNNYSQFFDDFNTGISTLITRLGPGGANEDELDDPSGSILALIGTKRNTIMSKSDLYLGGFDADNKDSMVELMNQVNQIINKLDNEGLDGDGSEISELIRSMGTFTGELDSGGNEFTDVLNVQFNTITENLRTIGTHVGDNQALTDLATKLDGIDDASQYRGLTVDDFAAIQGMQQSFADAANIYSNGGSLTEDELSTLLETADNLATYLKDEYSVSASTNSTNTVGSNQNNSGSNNVRNNFSRFRPGAASRATTGARR